MKTDKYKTVFFGNYYQSSSEEKEPIEWLVLDEKDSKQLLISCYGLDAKPYNEEWKEVTWETCTLRKWLNADFLNDAFSEEEKTRIEIKKVTADVNPRFDTDPGNDTKDKVFILSLNEVNEYFTSDDDRECKPTDYALAQGSYWDIGNGNCWWWLRSPGFYSGVAAGVNFDGGVSYKGNIVDGSLFTVRPAIWVKI